MSRPRSGSPRYRRFPWEEPDFDPHKVVAELDSEPMERGHRSRDGPEDWDYCRGDNHYPDSNRRSPPFQDDRHRRHPDQEEFYHRRPSPLHDGMGYVHQRLSPPPSGGGNGDRRGGGFRENFQHFDNRGRSPHSPPRLMRERLPPPPRADSEHRQREPGMGWRREEQDRGGQGRFRDVSPGERLDEQRVGAGRDRGRRSSRGPVRGRWKEECQHERSPPFKRQRRDMDGGGDHPGFRDEQHFGEQRYSVGSARGGFRGGPKGNPPRDNARHSAPLVIEHDHGFRDHREPPHWEKYDDRRDFDTGFDRKRSPRPMGSSQERFRSPDNRSDDNRGPSFQGNWRDSNYQETRRSPTPQERPNPMRFGNRDGFVNRRGRGGHHPARGRGGRGRGGRGQGGQFSPQRNLPHSQQSSQGYQDHEEQRPAYRPFREQSFDDPVQGDQDWAEEQRPPQWKQDRPGSLDRHLQQPQVPRQRTRPWNNQKPNNVPDVSEETLTIKVDMSRPMNQNSSLCYSSDRQLSLDLVNVGRQRLDFLPMLEHSGTYRETAMHTGTFAQEIITLVHYVKDQYFRDDGVTLNQRFSAPQKGGNEEEETEELTLDERFSSNRGFSLNLDSMLDDEEPLFFRQGQMQPVRGPGDLRHDLERRRQERLEGVKVTISGNAMTQQRPLGPTSSPDLDYSDKDEMIQDEDDFSSWSEDQGRRREGNMGPRRGASFNPNFGSQRRNHRFGNRLGPVRRQNMRGNPAASHW